MRPAPICKPCHQSPDQVRPEGGVGAAETGDPLPRGVTQVCAAWVEIICNPSYSGEYRINFISSLILPILLRNWSYITEAVPMCWSQKGDLWLWLVSSEPRANSPASYSIRAIYYSCVLQYWRISASWLLPSAHLVQLHVLFQASHCSRVLQYSRALVLKRIMGPSSTRNLNPSPWFANSHASYNIRALYCSCVLQYWRICKGTSWLLPCAVKGSSWYPLVIWWRPRIMRLTVFALATSPMLV